MQRSQPLNLVSTSHKKKNYSLIFPYVLQLRGAKVAHTKSIFFFLQLKGKDNTNHF